MKLRIKGNSIRIRLSKSEVTKLAEAGCLQESTQFPTHTFTYGLQSVPGTTELTASVEAFKIMLQVPATFAADWPLNEVVGMKSNQQLTGSDNLFLLLEKDFVCLDDTLEDQSDNYANPNKIC